MEFSLKNCRTGGVCTHPTTITIEEEGGDLLFTFIAEKTKYYCPYRGYNKSHSEGDACEILIGSDKERKVYYEIEVNPNNDIMLAKMTYQGVDERNGYEPILELAFVEKEKCFVKSSVEKTEGGYIARLRFSKRDIQTGDGEIFFNAYRLETDGGEKDKHLFALNPTMRSKFHAPNYFLCIKSVL